MDEAFFRWPFDLLQNEGYLVRSSLAAGLTDLRNANYADGRGRYYSGFFQLSIGLERLMKLTLIIDHMAQNNLIPPTSREVRDYGHDLEALFRAVADRASGEVRVGLDKLEPNSIEREILRFLSRFAQGARYHNLDSLGAGQPTPDPLAEWNDILTRVLRDDVPAKSRRRVEENARVVEALSRDVTWVMQNSLEGEPLSVRSGSELTGLLKLAAPRAMLRIFRLLKPLVEALSEATDRAQSTNQRVDPGRLGVPYMREFVDFVTADERYLRTRKRWP